MSTIYKTLHFECYFFQYEIVSLEKKQINLIKKYTI